MIESSLFPNPISYLYFPPKYITPLEDEYTPYKKYLSDAIVPKTLLRDWLSNICMIIRHPISIIEFRDKNPRIYINFSGETFKFICHSLRCCFGVIPCKNFEDTLISLFKGVNATTLENDVNRNIDKLIGLNGFDWADLPYSKPIFVSDKLRGHLEVVCPMSGFKELIFPIIIENKLIGVLFVGQVSLFPNKNIEKNVRKKYLDNKRPELNDYIKKVNNSFTNSELNTVDKAIELLMNGMQPLYNPFPIIKNDEIEMNFQYDELSNYIDTDNDFKALIDKIIKQLLNLEAKLSAELHNARKEYIHNCINVANDAFYKASISYDVNWDLSNNVMHKFWEVPKIIIQKLLDMFEIDYAIVFSPNDDTHNSKVLIPYIVTFNSQYIQFNAKSKLKFNLEKVEISKWPKKPQFYSSGSFMHNCLQGEITDINNINPLIFFPAIGGNGLPFVVLFSFNNKKKSKDVIEEILNCLMVFFVNVFYSLSTVISYLAKQQTENTMVMYRHETSQIAAGINSINENRINPNVSKFTNLKKQADVYEDIARLTFQLGAMSSRIKILQGRHVLEKAYLKDIWIIKEIFHNWLSVFSTIEAQRFIKIHVPRTHKEDELSPRICSDPVLLSQIIYNLLGNALKYSYIGTSIYLDYASPYEGSSEKILSVLNYGIEITNDQKLPYELYYTAENARPYSDNSGGIGLYVVKKAVEILGGQITHKCREICKYNVPYMKPYIECVNNGEIPLDNKKKASVEAEIKRLEVNGLYNLILSGKNITTTNFKVFPDEIQVEIENNKTYETKFEVIIYG
jgi:hypothetical protein